ncbi:hypothetical protein CcrColossus_gp211 [Caulobacter phage CcrColossus]|uniref:Uncharacterized protein n=1 Tax=Caulobacter phage CcrColossus TaxID=1211640 RepID=K4JSJ2_9CAUD|nr:hypothetical protein CcrColossus_gp211 [Caulobacter phage CcrColossus]AFU88081.1 hypothetical protein CcrColossus_gp211 [Caulobacter phage CcrColossus]
MTEYRRKSTPVKAWQYQPGAQKPQWLQEFRVFTPTGETPVVDSLGVLLVPTKSGVTQNAEAGEWLVLDETFSPAILSVVKPDAFEVAFEAIEAVDQVQAGVAEDVKPAAEAAPAAKAPRGRGAQAAEAAPEAPAAEASPE